MDYPAKDTREGWDAFGYESAMLHLAVRHDDPEGFMRFLGDPKEAECFICSSVVQYAAQHGAIKCLEALFDAGVKDAAHSRTEWREICRNDPPYGPMAVRLA